MNKSEFYYSLIEKKKKENDIKKTKRLIITILIISLIFSGILMYYRGIDNILDILIIFLVSLFLSCLYVYINTVIFSILDSYTEKDKKELQELYKAYDDEISRRQ